MITVAWEKGKMSKKEQILEYFKDINVAYNDYTMHDTLEHMLEDLEEVRYGHWEYVGGNLYRCSVCHKGLADDDNILTGQENYCGVCGAKMDERIDTPTGPVAK